MNIPTRRTSKKRPVRINDRSVRKEEKNDIVIETEATCLKTRNVLVIKLVSSGFSREIFATEEICGGRASQLLKKG